MERPFHQLAHNMVLAMPHLRWLRRFGTIPASHGNADAALERGATLLVYPGGDIEVPRPTWESARVDLAGRTGWVKLALRHRVPIVPVVSIGGQETALFLSRGERLARMLRIDRLFRLKVLPISLSIPWGLNVGDLLGHFPLPAKLTTQVGDRDTGKGARYRVLMQVGSAPVGGLVEIVEFDPCRDIAWTSVSGVDRRGRWRLRQLDNGRTKVELRLSYGAPGGLLGLIADRFSAPMVRRNLHETLQRVRDRAEERVSRGRGDHRG